VVTHNPSKVELGVRFPPNAVYYIVEDFKSLFIIYNKYIMDFFSKLSNLRYKKQDYLTELSVLADTDNFLESIKQNIEKENYSNYLKKTMLNKNRRNIDNVEYKDLFNKILTKYLKNNNKNQQQHMKDFFVFSKYNFMTSLTNTEKTNLNKFGFSKQPEKMIKKDYGNKTSTYDVFPIGKFCIPPLNHNSLDYTNNKIPLDHAYFINLSIRALFKQYKESIRNPLYSKYEEKRVEGVFSALYDDAKDGYYDMVDIEFLKGKSSEKYNWMDYSMNEDTAFFDFHLNFRNEYSLTPEDDRELRYPIKSNPPDYKDIDNKYQKKYNVLVDQYQKEKDLLNNNLSDEILDKPVTVFCSYLFPENSNDGDIIELTDNLVTTLNIHESSDRHMIRKYLHREDPTVENLKQIAIFLPQKSKIAPIIFNQIVYDLDYAKKKAKENSDDDDVVAFNYLNIKNKVYFFDRLKVVNDVRNIVLSDKGVLVKTKKSFLINFDKVNLLYFDDNDIKNNQKNETCEESKQSNKSGKDEQEEMNIPVFIYFNDISEANKFLELYNPSHEILHEEVIKNNSPIKHYIVGETTNSKSRSRSRSRSTKLNGGKNKKNKSKKQKTKK